jgi:hypothetical protein
MLRVQLISYEAQQMNDISCIATNTLVNAIKKEIKKTAEDMGIV